MPRFLFFTLGLLLSFAASSQQIDSLKLLLRSERPMNADREAYLNSTIGYYFYISKEYDSALQYYYAVWHDRDRINKGTLAESANGLGAVYSVKDYHDSALFYYEQAMMHYKAVADTTYKSHLLPNVAILYKDLGMYERALDISFEAIGQLEKKGNSRELASCYNTIASVYAKTKDLESALEFHKKALAVRKSLGLTKSVSHSYNNIGEVFSTLKMYDSAIANLERSIMLKRAGDDKKGIAVTLNNLGKVYLLQKKFKDAERTFLEVLASEHLKEDRVGLATTQINMSEVYADMGLYVKAEYYLDKAERSLRDIGSLEPLAEALKLRVRLLTARNRFGEAVKVLQELQVIRDSLIAFEKIESLMAVQVRYETDKKQEEISRLNERDQATQVQLDSQQRWIISLLIAAGLVLLLAGLVFMLFRTARKGKAKVETLLKELHHRVKNNLQMLSSLLILQSQELKDEKAVEAVKTSEGRVNAMALIHKKLYNTDKNREVNIKEYITELVQYLVQSYGFASRDLKLDLEIEAIQVDVDKAIPLGLIINELVTNAFKYAFADQQFPYLKINLTVQHHVLVLHLKDNGNGIPPEDSKVSESFGMRMVNALTRDLKGTLSISQNNGTGFNLNIPIG
jgi:two-component system, sensor histidine kinase PdtaS